MQNFTCELFKTVFVGFLMGDRLSKKEQWL